MCVLILLLLFFCLLLAVINSLGTLTPLSSISRVSGDVVLNWGMHSLSCSSVTFLTFSDSFQFFSFLSGFSRIFFFDSQSMILYFSFPSRNYCAQIMSLMIMLVILPTVDVNRHNKPVCQMIVPHVPVATGTEVVDFMDVVLLYFLRAHAARRKTVHITDS